MPATFLRWDEKLGAWFRKHRTRIGLVLTLAWLGGFGWWSLHYEPPIKGNEWGDWAAGMFAPVAFFWLVLGYFQQGDELRLNTEALKLQQLELQHQVAETAKLAANSERQAIAAEQMASATLDEKHRVALREQASALPIFRVIRGHQSASNVNLEIRNVGATVTQLSAESLEPGVSVRIAPTEVFEGAGEGKLRVSGASRFPFRFKISFTDTLGRHHTKLFEMTTPGAFREISAA